jgi:hypothetical protein
VGVDKSWQHMKTGGIKYFKPFERASIRRLAGGSAG